MAGYIVLVVLGLQGSALGQAPAAPTTTAAASPAAQPLPPGPWRVDPPPPPFGAPAPPGAGAGLPRDLSPWGMFVEADVVVQAVMVGLAVASVLTWTVWLAKSLELAGARRSAERHLRGLAAARALPEPPAERRGGAVPAMLAAASRELERSPDLPADGVKERLALALQRLEAAAGRRMTRGTGLLATVGSTAPFVGLFGTVWGIMNSFVGIAEAQTTNLAVVAPGIAEALLATALGLVAAIPAVVIYNGFARGIAGYRALLGDASAEILRHVSRDLDRARLAPMLRAAE